jgi:predicted RNA polymerase sigma factor
MVAKATFAALQFPVPINAARRLIVQALYREYGPRLVHFAVQRVRDEDAAEDIVQDAFSSILSGRFPVPAVDVRRKLQEVVRYHCAVHKKAEATIRSAKEAFRKAHERSDKSAWRAWRSGLARRGDARNDDDHEVDQ